MSVELGQIRETTLVEVAPRLTAFGPMLVDSARNIWSKSGNFGKSLSIPGRCWSIPGKCCPSLFESGGPDVGGTRRNFGRCKHWSKSTPHRSKPRQNGRFGSKLSRLLAHRCAGREEAVLRPTWASDAPPHTPAAGNSTASRAAQLKQSSLPEELPARTCREALPVVPSRALCCNKQSLAYKRQRHVGQIWQRPNERSRPPNDMRNKCSCHHNSGTNPAEMASAPGSRPRTLPLRARRNKTLADPPQQPKFGRRQATSGRTLQLVEPIRI